jgi:hypothetical protein
MRRCLHECALYKLCGWLVRVEAAGLNQLDEKIRAGEFKQILPYKLPRFLTVCWASL